MQGRTSKYVPINPNRVFKEDLNGYLRAKLAQLKFPYEEPFIQITVDLLNVLLDNASGSEVLDRNIVAYWS